MLINGSPAARLVNRSTERGPYAAAMSIVAILIVAGLVVAVVVVLALLVVDR